MDIFNSEETVLWMLRGRGRYLELCEYKHFVRLQSGFYTRRFDNQKMSSIFQKIDSPEIFEHRKPIQVKTKLGNAVLSTTIHLL